MKFTFQQYKHRLSSTDKIIYFFPFLPKVTIFLIFTCGWVFGFILHAAHPSPLGFFPTSSKFSSPSLPSPLPHPLAPHPSIASTTPGLPRSGSWETPSRIDWLMPRSTQMATLEKIS